MSDSGTSSWSPQVIDPGQGRKYDMGRMHAVFFADAAQTGGNYSISEWFLDPMTKGPGAHDHPDDHIFHVLSGTLSLVIAGRRTDATCGTYALIPGGVSHDFENHTGETCRFISINIPAGFEQMMPQLETWFAENPLRRVDE